MSVLTAKMAPRLGGVPETLLIPLWARAVEQSHPDPLIVDPDAARIVESLDYDFSAFQRKHVATENFCARSRVVDDLVSQILTARPGTPVVEFGAGLDTRFQRLGHLASDWLEVDFPEVISLRKQFFDAHPQRTAVSGSMLEPDWIDACGHFSSPPLFVAEGVFYFFSDDQVRNLLLMIREHFPGSSFVFDAVGPAYLKLSNLLHPLAGSRLQFSLSPGAEEIPKWDSEWTIQDYIGYGDSPWYDSVMPRFSWWKKAAVRWLPTARHAFMVVNAAASSGNTLGKS
jgi:O-methyltransferase involved in polyketide biosynthesis